MMHDDGMPKLPENQARWDRALRIGFALLLFGIGITGAFAEPVAGWLRVGAFVPFITGSLGWCPLYQAFGIRTRAGFRRRVAAIVRGDGGRLTQEALLSGRRP
jgi:hypothetical protein